ncbi:MAG: flagellar hook-associated protein FlgK [Gammaproteobacteria bacterium]|nr:flagellar hook-associated protein FlgK [Gammaproteobacteria bacterium]
MADLLNIGVSGLLAFQRNLATTSNNISNVNTPGYSRQRVELGTRQPQFSGAGYVGNGVQVSGIQRVYDSFLTSQIRTSTSTNSQLQSLYSYASQVDNLLADSQSGLSPALQDFFGAVQGVADDPASTPARQVLLSNAAGLTDRFQYLNQRLVDLRNGVNTQLQTTTTEINSLAQGIANVNKGIADALGSGGGAAPNDLLDKRDTLIAQLAERVAVTTIPQDDGAVNVFIGNGQSLVVGTASNTLVTSSNAYDPARLEVAFKTGTTTVIISDSLTGGTLGGALQFRNQVLDSAQNSLGRLATGLVNTFNAQHLEGQDLNGAPGAAFFKAGPVQVLARSSNGGSGVVSAAIADANALTSSDYRLQNNAGTYTVTRLSDNTVTTLAGFPGAPATVDGVTISLSSGVINSGDSFLIQPTRNGARDISVAISDPRKIAVAAPIRTGKPLSNLGSAKVSAGEVLNSANPALLNTVTITFNNPPTTFAVTGVAPNPSPVAYTSGANIAYNGWQIQITGTPQAGDTFTLQQNTNGVSDNRNALLLGGLQTQLTLAGSSASYQDLYGQVVAQVGSTTHQADISRQAQESLLGQVTAARDAVSGVNLDEEAADLVRFQQAYQAAAQVISSSNSLFDALLNAVRR